MNLVQMSRSLRDFLSGVVMKAKTGDLVAQLYLILQSLPECRELQFRRMRTGDTRGGPNRTGIPFTPQGMTGGTSKDQIEPLEVFPAISRVAKKEQGSIDNEYDVGRIEIFSTNSGAPRSSRVQKKLSRTV